MSKGDAKIDFTDTEKADKKLAELKDKATDPKIKAAIEKKQSYVNKPVCK